MRQNKVATKVPDTLEGLDQPTPLLAWALGRASRLLQETLPFLQTRCSQGPIWKEG